MYKINYRLAGENRWREISAEFQSKETARKCIPHEDPRIWPVMDWYIFDTETGKIVDRMLVLRIAGLSFEEFYRHRKGNMDSTFNQGTSETELAQLEVREKNLMEFLWYHSNHGSVRFFHTSVNRFGWEWDAVHYSVDFRSRLEETERWEVLARCSCGYSHEYIGDDTPEEFRGF